MTRVALYARASSTKQEHSAPGQIADLQADADANGRQVVEEISDVGEKRHDADRPGLNRLRELAEEGAIDEVWAWAWDRYGEFPVPENLTIDLEYFGVKLRSLDDNGPGEDNEFMTRIKSLLSWREQRERVRRANRGRRNKSERGELFGGFRARYGFAFVKGKNQRGTTVNVGYEPNSDTMPNVVRVFEMIANGAGLKTVRAAFERERVPNPSGNPRWSTTTIRNIVNEDSYRPHTVEELRELGISANVLNTLNPNSLYGIHWSGRKRSQFKGRSKKREVYEAPREEWTGVPVPIDGSGLDRATVDRAREAIKDNVSPAKVGDRVFELSGGILKCAECERNMISYRRAKQSGYNYYYRCRPSNTVDEYGNREVCANRKSHPAEKVESEVYNALRGMVDDQEMLAEKITETFAQKRRELSRIASDTAPLIERLTEIDQERKGYLRQNARGQLEDRELDTFLADLSEEREALQESLESGRHRDER